MKVYSSSPKVVVIGAGIGGLTSAAALARNGLDVTVLEAHTYPGGCAGTFFHRGYRFDAGATLAGGFYPGGPMDMVADMVGIQDWSAHPSEPAVIVHMPDGTSIHRYADERRWDEYRHVFGPKAERFFIWQENTADALWDLALQLPPWPPHSPFQLIELAFIGSRWLAENPQRNANPRLLVDVFTPLSRQLNQLSEKLRLFIDAQLLISAQTTSRYASSLYAASALDLPRRGVVQLRGGMISISQKLVQAIRDHGGQVLFRKEVKRIVTKGSECVGVETCGREFYPAEYLIANLPVDNVNQMLGIDHDNLYPPAPSDGWGAFMVYMGVDGSSIPAEFPLHHQIIHSEPLGETNSVFLSISPDWDAARAPLNKRAITVSTHTDLRSWWELYQSQPEQYGARKEAYLEKIIRSVECVLPGIRGSMDLALPGTPITFQRYTRRSWGWVGGFPQTSLLRSHKPYLGGDIWLVGDSIFPGQSVPAVALGGLRVAGMILSEAHGRNKIFSGRRKIYRPVNITAKGSIAAALPPKRHFKMSTGKF